ncbi:hypothetical protein HPB49_005037 [Dermacentor silvarum]|uniref:Uncharacterized protein n=1 Tax=Dermacentor silvarum TaxID=543639 RepID=A0ACB8DN36_DERSI|nr:hypothetical protein HPB49_005037 [Dermacentor silvarum]
MDKKHLKATAHWVKWAFKDSTSEYFPAVILHVGGGYMSVIADTHRSMEAQTAAAEGQARQPLSEVPGSPPKGAFDTLEGGDDAWPLLLLLVVAAVIAFMVVLIIGTVVLTRRDAKKLSLKTPMAATIASLTRKSLTAKTPLPAAPVSNAVSESSAPDTVSIEMAKVTGIAPGHQNDSEATGHVSSDKAMENPNSSSVSEHGLATESGTLNTTSEISGPEHSTLDTETVGAATEPANASVSAAGGGEGRNYVSTDEAMNVTGDEGMSVMKFSDNAVASLSSTMDVTVVRLDVSDNAQTLSTEEVEIAKSWTPGLAASNDTTGSVQGITST